jgi:hypothetical protein
MIYLGKVGMRKLVVESLEMQRREKGINDLLYI